MIEQTTSESALRTFVGVAALSLFPSIAPADDQLIIERFFNQLEDYWPVECRLGDTRELFAFKATDEGLTLVSPAPASGASDFHIVPNRVLEKSSQIVVFQKDGTLVFSGNGLEHLTKVTKEEVVHGDCSAAPLERFIRLMYDIETFEKQQQQE